MTDAPTARETADQVPGPDDVTAPSSKGFLSAQGEAAWDKPPHQTADHAELARLAEAAMPGPFATMGEILSGRDAFIYAFSPAVCSALLSEIAALRGERDGLRNRVSCLERLGGEQSTRVMKQATRAKDAERQRDELRKALDRQCDNMSFVLNRVELHAWHGKFEREVAEDRALIAKQGAD